MKEYRFKASSLNFWSYFSIAVGGLLLGLAVGQLLLPDINFTRLIFAGTVMLLNVLFFFTVFKKNVIVKINSQQLTIYENNIEKLNCALEDIDRLLAIDLDKMDVAGDVKIILKNKETYYFSLLVVSNKYKKAEQGKLLRKLLQILVHELSLKKEVHRTKLGKSLTMMQYVNQ